MEINKITQVTLTAHTAIEELVMVMRQAKEDKRFHFSLADSRAFRDLVDDMENMLNEAWRTSIEVPIDLPVDGEMQTVSIKINP